MESAQSACAVICEYNPLHFGHCYQLSEVKKRYQTVICILGSNITQRGEAAIADRYVRAEAALKSGADLVLELPLPWCCASAADFAFGGVSIAESINVDALAFSSESSESALLKMAKTKRENTQQLQQLLTHGKLSYPKAVQEIVGSSLEAHPNDILGLEYLDHLSSVSPYIIRRDNAFLSSRTIRSSENPLDLLPDSSKAVFAMDPSFPRESCTLDSFILASLRNLPQKSCYAVPDELYQLLVDNVVDCRSVKDLVSACSGKMFTAARIRRAIWSIILQISPEMVHQKPSYTLLLGINANGRKYLNQQSAECNHFICSRPADVLSDSVFQLNLRANRIFQTFFGGKDDLAKHPIVLTEESL